MFPNDFKVIHIGQEAKDSEPLIYDDDHELTKYPI